MSDSITLPYKINDPVELNLSYMPFINDGGLFIPSQQHFSLGDALIIELQLPGIKEVLKIDGKVVWITPENALHHVLPGVGVQFVGPTAKTIKGQIESFLDTTMEIGGYTYGITEEAKKK